MESLFAAFDGAPRRSRWSEFVAFSKLALSSTDIDPVYPVFRELFAAERIDDETKAWRLAIFLTFYHVGSAVVVWEKFPEPSLSAIKLIEAMPTGVERRGMRGNQARVHSFLSSVMKNARGPISEWIDRSVGDGGEDGWRSVRRSMEACSGAGQWASYKWADLVKHVLGRKITADNIGVGGGSQTAGPVPCLALLSGKSWQQVADDERGIQRETYDRAVADGVPFNGLDQFETALCDFFSLLSGRYYVGHDIDAMQTQLSFVGKKHGIWEARQRAIPNAYLGELNGWAGVRTHLKKYFKETGRYYEGRCE